MICPIVGNCWWYSDPVLSTMLLTGTGLIIVGVIIVLAIHAKKLKRSENTAHERE